MITIPCDEQTAVAIIVDDASEISLEHAEWVAIGSPTIGDTIAFDVQDETSGFAEAFGTTRYLVTDEFEHDGWHIVSFVTANMEPVEPSYDVTDATQDDEAALSPVDFGDFMDYDPTADESADGMAAVMTMLSDETAAESPIDAAFELSSDTDAVPNQDFSVLKNASPSMRLIAQLMDEHHMSLHDIGLSMMALDAQGDADKTEHAFNTDVMVHLPEDNDIDDEGTDIDDVSQWLPGNRRNDTPSPSETGSLSR